MMNMREKRKKKHFSEMEIPVVISYSDCFSFHTKHKRKLYSDHNLFCYFLDNQLVIFYYLYSIQL